MLNNRQIISARLRKAGFEFIVYNAKVVCYFILNLINQLTQTSETEPCQSYSTSTFPDAKLFNNCIFKVYKVNDIFSIFKPIIKPSTVLDSACCQPAT